MGQWESKPRSVRANKDAHGITVRLRSPAALATWLRKPLAARPGTAGCAVYRWHSLPWCTGTFPVACALGGNLPVCSYEAMLPLPQILNFTYWCNYQLVFTYKTVFKCF